MKLIFGLSFIFVLITCYSINCQSNNSSASSLLSALSRIRLNDLLIVSSRNGTLSLAIPLGNGALLNLGRLLGRNGPLNISILPGVTRNPNGTLTTSNGTLLNLGALLGSSNSPGLLNLSLLLGNGGVINLNRLLGSNGLINLGALLGGTGTGITSLLTNLLSALSGVLRLTDVLVTSTSNGVLGLAIPLGNGVVNLGTLVGPNGPLNISSLQGVTRNSDGTINNSGGALLNLGALLGTSNSPGLLNLGLLIGGNSGGVINLNRLLGPNGLINLGALLSV